MKLDLGESVRPASAGPAVREGDQITMPVRFEHRVMLVIGNRAYELGWLSEPDELVPMMREVIAEMERA